MSGKPHQLRILDQWATQSGQVSHSRQRLSEIAEWIDWAPSTNTKLVARSTRPAPRAAAGPESAGFYDLLALPRRVGRRGAHRGAVCRDYRPAGGQRADSKAGDRGGCDDYRIDRPPAQRWKRKELKSEPSAQIDTDADSTQKGGTYYLGYKGHIGVGSKRIRRLSFTGACPHDFTQTEELLSEWGRTSHVRRQSLSQQGSEGPLPPAGNILWHTGESLPEHPAEQQEGDGVNSDS